MKDVLFILVLTLALFVGGGLRSRQRVAEPSKGVGGTQPYALTIRPSGGGYKLQAPHRETETLADFDSLVRRLKTAYPGVEASVVLPRHPDFARLSEALGDRALSVSFD